MVAMVIAREDDVKMVMDNIVAVVVKEKDVVVVVEEGTIRVVVVVEDVEETGPIANTRQGVVRAHIPPEIRMGGLRMHERIYRSHV